MSSDWSDIVHFERKEFDSPDEPGSGIKMSMDFVRKLDMVRETCGIPMVINSGYRTQNHNKEVGGATQSAHCQGYAVDVHCTNKTQRRALVRAALLVGIKRISIGKTIVHLDDDPKRVAVLAFYPGAGTSEWA